MSPVIVDTRWLATCGLMCAVEPVDAHQKRGEGLARSSRRGDQCVPARSDLRPAPCLRLGRAIRKSTGEPGSHGRMERLKHQVTLTQATDSRAQAAELCFSGRART